MRCISAHHFSTIIDIIVHYRYFGRLYFSLFNDVCVFLIGQELKKLRFFIDYIHFYFFNSDISVTLHVMRLTFSEGNLKVLLEGSVSQIFYLGPSFYFI